MERKDVNALMERWAEMSAEERSSRKLILHDERSSRKLILHNEAGTPAAVGTSTANSAAQNTTPPFLTTRLMKLVRWSSAACVAAMAVGLALFVTPEAGAATITCTVNGVSVTDPSEIERYTIEALELASESLRRPAENLSQTLGSESTMSLVGEMLNELTKEQ